MLEGVLVIGAVQQVLGTGAHVITLDLPLVIDATFCAGSAMIAYGAVLVSVLTAAGLRKGYEVSPTTPTLPYSTLLQYWRGSSHSGQWPTQDNRTPAMCLAAEFDIHRAWINPGSSRLLYMHIFPIIASPQLDCLPCMYAPGTYPMAQGW